MRSLRTPLAVLATALLAAFSTSAFATDTDLDGLPDDYEAEYGTNPNDDDTDGDGWDDYKEVVEEGTDALESDTDGDTVGDSTDPDPLLALLEATDGGEPASHTGWPSGDLYAWSGESAMDANRMKKRTEIDRTNGSNTKVTEWKRNALGVVRKEIDPLGYETTRTADGLGRVTQESRDMGSSAAIVTTWTWSEFHDEMTTLTDDNGSDTEYAFNDLGRLVEKSYEDATTVAYEYDLNGNVLTITDQMGTEIEQGFDDLDRLTVRDATLATGVGGDTEHDFAYDALNRMTVAADNDSRVEFAYDSLSRVLSETQGSNPFGSTGKVVSYTWDAEGNRTKIVYPSSFEARETRDALGRITEIKDQSNVSVAAFDLYGPGLRKKKVTFGNSTTGNWTYDGFRRPTNIEHKTSGASEFAGFEYAWDKNDNPLYEARSHKSGKGDVYTYDKANRLTKTLTDVDDPAAEIASPGSEAYVKKLEYDMDDVFNLTAYKTTPYGGSTTTTSFSANAMNEYTTVGGVSHTYHDNGSLKDDGTNEYKYDAWNHLIEVKRKSDSVVIGSYKYDAVGLGRRTKKTADSLTTRFVYADMQSVEELDDADGDLLRIFVFGQQIDQIVMMEAPDQADVDDDENTTEIKRFFYHTQLIGTVTHVTDASQATVESYEYDPYGRPTIKDIGGSTVAASPIGSAYNFASRQLDEETGLLYMRARHYSAILRRFIERDSIEYSSSPSAFAYCSSRPTRVVDPLGLQDDLPQGAEPVTPAPPADSQMFIPVFGDTPEEQMADWDSWVRSHGVFVFRALGANEHGEAQSGNGRAFFNFSAEQLVYAKQRHHFNYMKRQVFNWMNTSNDGKFSCAMGFITVPYHRVTYVLYLRKPDEASVHFAVPFIDNQPQNAQFGATMMTHEKMHKPQMTAFLRHGRDPTDERGTVTPSPNPRSPVTGSGDGDTEEEAEKEALADAWNEARKAAAEYNAILNNERGVGAHHGGFPFHGWPGTEAASRGEYFPYK